jgi:hypothetical protein
MMINMPQCETNKETLVVSESVSESVACCEVWPAVAEQCGKTEK